MADLGKEFLNTIKKSDERKTQPFDSVGTVTRVKDGVAYVHFAGGVDETPVKLTINAQAGDEVQVRVADGKAWLMGNATRPPTDDAQARRAINLGKQANDAAVKATKDAMVAHEAAESASADAKTAKDLAESVEGIAEQARTDAGIAKTAADTAVSNLSQVQEVLEVVEWVAKHGTYTKATTFNPNATYYTVTATEVTEPSNADVDSHGVLIYYEEDDGIYVRTEDETVDDQKTYYRVTGTPVSEPKQEHLSQYYTLAVTEAMANYIKSHLALTDEGLYVMKDGSQWKVQVADDGVYILNPNNKPANQMTGDGDIIGYEDETHAEIDYHSLQLLDKEGNVYFHVSDLRANHTAQEKYGEGYYYVHTETHVVSGGQQKSFELIGEVWNNKCTVKVDDVETTAFSVSSNIIILNNWLREGKTVTIEYASQSPKFKAYTLGTRNGVVGVYSVAEGYNTTASGEYTHAEGIDTTASGKYSHAEGIKTRAIGEGSHAEGSAVDATGKYSHAEGYRTEASDIAAHAEGNSTRATAQNAHAEGYSTHASVYNSHAEGSASQAAGGSSHAEGYYTYARGDSAHAEGYKTKAKGDYSHTQNKETIAEYEAQTAIGKYNSNDPNNAFEIGNGTDEEHRSNAFAVDWDGNVKIALDTSAQSGVDKDIYDALVALNWDDCIRR